MYFPSRPDTKVVVFFVLMTSVTFACENNGDKMKAINCPSNPPLFSTPKNGLSSKKRVNMKTKQNIKFVGGELDRIVKV